MSFLDSVISSIGSGGGSTFVPPLRTTPAAQPTPRPTSVLAKRKAEDERKRSSESSPSTTQIQSIQERPVPAAVLAKKKNSYAAIMARAEEAKAKNSITSIGSIKHKPKEKSKTMKEIADERKAQKLALRKGVPLKRPESKHGGMRSKPESSRLAIDGKPQTPSSSYKGSTRMTEQSKGMALIRSMNTESKYTGTARIGGYTGTMQNGRNHNQAQSRRSNRDYDDDDDSEGSYGRDDDGYYDESDDDMDAGFDAVEDEEEEASRAARREDAAAQAELERLAKEKARKKALLTKGKH